MADYISPPVGLPPFHDGTELGRALSKAKWITMLNTLEAGGHAEQLLILSELSTYLSYATEDTLLGFPAWSYLKVLMHMIQHPRVKYASMKKRKNANMAEELAWLDPDLPFCKMIESQRNRAQRQQAEQAAMLESSEDEEESDTGAFTHPDLPPHINLLPHELKDRPTIRDRDVDLISEDMAVNKSITAASCVNIILDILPHSASFFMSNSAQLDALQRQLEDIEYIDLAERILLIYEKLVKEIPVTVVKSGALITMMRFIDFFPLDVQVGTLTAIVLAVKRIERGDSVRSFLIPLVPYATQALRNGNKKIVQLACCMWKSIINTMLRASYKNTSHLSEVMGSMVRSVVSSDAVRDMCTVVFKSSGKLNRENVIECIYCLAVVTNESNELMSQIATIDVLPIMHHWLGNSCDSVLLRLVDLGLAMLGSYHSIDPLVIDCNQLYRRADYYSDFTTHLQAVAETYSIRTLVGIFDNTASQQLRNRLLLMILRLLEMACEVPICVGHVIDDLPLFKVLDAVCYTLRFQSQEEHSEVAVHIITCLMRLMEPRNIVDTLGRYGLSALLRVLKRPAVQHEVRYIMDSLPPPPKHIVTKSEFEMIAAIKDNSVALTHHELLQYGLMEMNYEKLVSRNALPDLLGSVIKDGGQYFAPSVNEAGIQALWRAFGSVLEAQPEFKPRIVKDFDSDDETTDGSPMQIGWYEEAMQPEPSETSSLTASSEALAMLDNCTLTGGSVSLNRRAMGEAVNTGGSTSSGRANNSGEGASSSSSSRSRSSGRQLLISTTPGSEMALVSDLAECRVRPEDIRTSPSPIEIRRTMLGTPGTYDSIEVVEHVQVTPLYEDDQPQQQHPAAPSQPVANEPTLDVAPDGHMVPVQDAPSVVENPAPTDAPTDAPTGAPTGAPTDAPQISSAETPSAAAPEQSRESRIHEEINGVIAQMHENGLGMEDVLDSVQLLAQHYEDNPLLNTRTRANTTTAPRTRSRRSESRPRKSSDDRSRRNGDQHRKILEEQAQFRNRLRHALSFITSYTRSDALPYPLNCVTREVKLQISCIDTDELLVGIPPLSIRTPSLVSVSKIETYVLTYLNAYIKEPPRNLVLSPNKKARLYTDDGKFGGYYLGVQIYYKDRPLAPSMCLYQALIMLNGGEKGAIWEEINELSYTATRRVCGPTWSLLLSGRHSPLVAHLCEDRHSPFGLFLGLSSYVNGVGKAALPEMLRVLKERLVYVDGREDAVEMRAILNEVMKIRSPTDASSRFSLDADATESFNGMTISSVDKKSKPVKHADLNTPEMDYYVDCVVQALERMDEILSGKTSDDVLFATRLTAGEESELSEDSRNQLQMMVVIYTLMTELSLFLDEDPIRVPFSKRMTFGMLNLLSNVEEALCYHTPTWFIQLMLICPHMFSFETRRMIFEVLATGPHRLMSQFQTRLCALFDTGTVFSKYTEAHTADSLDDILRQRLFTHKTVKPSALVDIETTLRLPKLKASCSRLHVVRDAMIIMDQVARSVADLGAVPRLEIEFDDETGTGSGPAQEFYTMVIEALLGADANGCSPVEVINGYVYPKVYQPPSDWVDDFDLSVFKRASKCTMNGRAADGYDMIIEEMMDDNVTTRVFRLFKLLGQMCASAMLDNKLLEFSLHPLFWKLCQNPYSPKNCSMYALSAVDPMLACSLTNLLTYENVADAGLYFMYQGIPLVENGENVLVTTENVIDYVRGVIRVRLYDGIRLAVWSFRMGFAMMVPLDSLALFTPLELADVFSTGDNDAFWTRDHLLTNIVPDHGYESTSEPYQALINVLTELSEDERRKFLRFCTGAPTLPKEGFAGLRPLMRVVKKCDSSDDLPSVMTCSNYLKLPEYEDLGLVKTKLLQAIEEGQGSFYLS